MTRATSTPPQDATAAEGVIRVVKQRHPGRWLVGGVLVAIVALALHSVATNERFGWSAVLGYLFDRQILDGVYLTLFLTFVCMAIGIVLGTVLAIMRLSANPVVQALALAYVGFFRGTPVLVQLIFWFNFAALYPHLSFGIPGVDLDANALISPLLAGILGLGLHEAAYMAEIIRGGIRSIDKGQMEAARALGLRKNQVLRRIVLPQAMTMIVPPTGNEAVGMLKTSSLVSVLAVGELLYSAQLIYSSNYQTIPLLVVASLWYLALTAVLSAGQFYLERHFSHGQSGAPAKDVAIDQLRHWLGFAHLTRRGER
ncbi:amino acid ABC transporter permease [Mycobacterium sp. NPDC003449]